MEPFSTGGVYVNGAAEEPSSAAYGVNYDRLAEIKKAYDPTNFFRHNKNIAPAS
jgi:FAD/FMN-containing dehydrogenase